MKLSKEDEELFRLMVDKIEEIEERRNPKKQSTEEEILDMFKECQKEGKRLQRKILGDHFKGKPRSWEERDNYDL